MLKNFSKLKEHLVKFSAGGKLATNGTRSYSSFNAIKTGGWFNGNRKVQTLVFGLTSSAIFAATYYGLKEPDSIKNDMMSGFIPVAEVVKHNKLNDCWIAINGKVFDVTNFLSQHPGGVERIMKYAGKDASLEFSQIHSSAVLDKMMSYLDVLGHLKGNFEEVVTEEMKRIQDFQRIKPGIHTILNITEFEYVAKQLLPHSTYVYFRTGASEEFSLRENYDAYGRVFFRPMILQDNGPPNTDTEMLGNKVDIPVYITAFAGSKYAHPLGERNLQRAAYRNNAIQMVPKLLSYSMDEFFDEVPSDQQQWCQLHFDTQAELDNVENTIKKIESFNTVKGIFINVDLADLGNRERDTRNRLDDQVAAAEFSSIANNGNTNYPKSFGWKDIQKIRSLTKLPIALKGVQRGEDVVLAAEKGINGVLISNHGGRQLDFSRPPLEVLVEARQMLKEKNLQDKIELYVDGGIRRGSDVIKALCLGAKGVGMGRPFLFAMASYGEEGVSRVFQILQEEMKNNMKLLGVERIDQLNEGLVDISNLKSRGTTNKGLYGGIFEQEVSDVFREK